MFFILILFLVLLGACSEEQPAEEEREVFDGPIRKGTDITMTYAEETIKMVVLKAKTLLEFKAGDREFPDGIFIEFYDENEILSTTLEGNKGYYYRAENLWKVTGDVKVISFEKNQQLNSEELFWDPDRKKIYTEKFVTIRLEKEVIYGTGLESNQDFTDYTIDNPKGEFFVQ